MPLFRRLELDILARSLDPTFLVLPYRVRDKRKDMIKKALHLSSNGLHENDIGRLLSTNPQQISQWLEAHNEYSNE